MALETGTFISDLVATNPVGSDPLAFADDHIRLVKSTIKNTFPNISGAVTKTHTQINTAVDQAATAVQPAAMDAAIAAAINSAIAAAKSALYPVGSIYVNATNSTNPASLLGFGTWVEFGSGRVMVGQNTGDTSFDVLEETGGSKDAIVVAHTHTGSTASSGAHQHFTAWNGGSFGGSQYSPTLTSTTTIQAMASNGDERYCLNGTSNAADGGLTSSSGAHSHSVTVDSTGSSGTNANLQPYVVVKMWKRTA